jgi:NAD(P)-dependent dehydrogenase (short-subunit alcohol dehydrogenase family)
MSWTANNIPPQAGRRILITGGNSGLGFHAALELARRGAEIILPTRSEAKAADAIRRIRADVPEARIVPALLDLASLASVRSFAVFYGERFPGASLDVLINNAGIMSLPTREVTDDGFERQLATNYLGPFALTGLLLPHLKPQAGTRVVSLSSVAAQRGKIEFENLQGERKYSPLLGAYAQSKLADLIFAREMQRRLSEAGSPILSIAAHPGIAATNLFSNMTGFLKTLASLVSPLIGQSAAAGALPELFAATAPEVEPGGYYGPDGSNERKGFPTSAKIPKAAKDELVSRRLWDVTEGLTGVKFDFGPSNVSTLSEAVAGRR